MHAFFAFFLLAALPAGAQTPSRQLCAMTGRCDDLDFGHYGGREGAGRPDVERRCIPCEREAQAELERSWANLQHPKQLVLAGSPLVILGEDVAAANGTMAALELTLEGILAVEALPEAVALGVGLMAFNAVLSPRDSSRATRIPLPLWLNLLAVSEATAEKTCADLRAEQTAACRDQPPEPCGKYDSCDELRAKRKPLVECARAWKALAGKDCAVAAGDEDSKAQNGKGLKLCGKLISGNPACCSDDVKRQKKTACPSDLRGCADDAKVSDAEYLALDPAGQVAVCAAIAAKKIGAAACLIARVRERDECFQGLDEPQHAGEIEKADRMIRNCDDALANLSVLRVCP